MDSDRVIRYGLIGSSDILGIYKGIFLAVEVKTGNAVQSGQQVRFQKMVDELGGIYIICRDTNVETLLTRIEDAFQGKLQNWSRSC